MHHVIDRFTGGLSAGMALRLAWSMASAVAGVWLLGRALRRPPASGAQTGWTRPLRLAALALCGLWSGVWLALALLRLGYPYELEWNGGAMLDHSERVLNHLPLYVRPGPGWFPFEYPPLYFWVCAALMRLGDGESYVPMRLVSILSTVGCAALIFVYVRSLVVSRGAGRTWALIAAGLFLASYRFTGAWYDLERLDMLFMLLTLTGAVCLLRCLSATGGADSATRQEYSGPPILNPSSVFRPPSTSWAAAAAVALSLAFLTKQQALLFILAGGAALAWAGAGRPLAVFAVLTGLLCGGAVVALNADSQGWFGYYCFHVPIANGIRASLVPIYFCADLPLYAPCIGILLLVLRAPKPPGPEEGAYSAPVRNGRAALATLMLAAGLLVSFLSRAHWGGDQNVLIPGFVFLGASACAVAGRWQHAIPRGGAPLYLLMVCQLLTLSYRPDAQLPTAVGSDAGRRFQAAVHDLEREGEVLCIDHGHVTRPRHFHTLGLRDAMEADGGMPPDLSAALQAHRYAAIVMDARPSGSGTDQITRYYQVRGTLGIPTTWVVTGYPTPSPSRTVYVLRPRRALARRGGRVSHQERPYRVTHRE